LKLSLILKFDVPLFVYITHVDNVPARRIKFKM